MLCLIVIPLDDAVFFEFPVYAAPDDIREQKRKLRVYDIIVTGQVESLELLRAVEAPFLLGCN